MIITIDGPAAAGKGTLAATLAQKYRLAYFDTGMVYRAVGLEMRLSGKEIKDEAAAAAFARSLTFPRMMELSRDPRFRDDVGGQYASIVAAMPEVRAALLQMQQDFALRPVFADGTPAAGAIYDGRDTGTVVCPGADIKFYVTASPEVRASRRLLSALFAGRGAGSALSVSGSDTTGTGGTALASGSFSNCGARGWFFCAMISTRTGVSAFLAFSKIWRRSCCSAS